MSKGYFGALESEAKHLEEKSWRCFHCNELFTNPKHAAEHFGDEMHDTPACKLSHSEGHLVALVRKLQRELASYRREDNLVLRAWESREAEHRERLRREEEKGYARGMADMKNEYASERDRLALLHDTTPTHVVG